MTNARFTSVLAYAQKADNNTVRTLPLNTEPLAYDSWEDFAKALRSLTIAVPRDATSMEVAFRRNRRLYRMTVTPTPSGLEATIRNRHNESRTVLL